MGATESRSALLEQAIANLLAVAPVRMLPTRPRDPFDFYFVTQQNRRVAVEVKAFVPPPQQLRKLAAKVVWTERAPVDEFWLVTPNPPSERALVQFETDFSHPIRQVRWLGQQTFQRALGIEPRPLRTDEDFARLQIEAAAARLLDEQSGAQPLPQPANDVGWAQFGRLQLVERVSLSGPQALRDGESVSAYLRLGEQGDDVTTLTSDLANYSALVRVRPREVVDVMNRYYRRARQIVLQGGGFFYQFTGDGVVALFGYPRQDPGAPIRAIHAAADLIVLGRDTLEDLANRMNEAIPVGTRIGIATDDLSALNSSDQSFEPAFIGNSINLAARLQTTASIDGVVMDNKSYRAIAADAETALVQAYALQIPRDEAKGQLADINGWRVEGSELLGLARRNSDSS